MSEIPHVCCPQRQKGKGLRFEEQPLVEPCGKSEAILLFPRAIVVKEDGVEEFSNIKRLTYIPFKKGKIDDTLAEIDRVLIRERVIPADGLPPPNRKAV